MNKNFPGNLNFIFGRTKYTANSFYSMENFFSKENWANSYLLMCNIWISENKSNSAFLALNIYSATYIKLLAVEVIAIIISAWWN